MVARALAAAREEGRAEGPDAALIRAMEEAKEAYAPDRNSDFYRGIMHGMRHAIDIVRRAPWPSDLAERIVSEIGLSGDQTFAVGANLSRAASIIRKHLEAAGRGDG